MKKMLFFLVGVLTVLVVLFYLALTPIMLNSNDNISKIIIVTPNNRVFIKNSKDIKEVITNLNSIKYFKSGKLKIETEEINASIILFDQGGKVTKSINIYGTVAYDGFSKYLVLPFTYSKIDSICEKYKDKSE